MKIIITGACAVSARSVLRSLKISPYFTQCEFIGWDMADNLYGLYENLFDKVYKVPSVSANNYRDIVESILEAERPDAVIVVPEVEVLYWAENPFTVPHLVPPVDFCKTAISKKILFDLLKDTDYIPKSYEISRADIEHNNFNVDLPFPMWIRDSSPCTASGKGSFMAHNFEQIKAWTVINPESTSFQVSEYLPGGNFGCFCLFKNGELKKLAIAERINYIMAKVAISGITGNTSKGRLLNDDRIKNLALNVIHHVAEHADCVMDGLVVVDMKADNSGQPKVTEINIRHVAFSSSFANAGFNLSEAHLLCTLDKEDILSEEIEKEYPIDNLLLRDVDGLPIYVPYPQSLEVGEYISK